MSTPPERARSSRPSLIENPVGPTILRMAGPMVIGLLAVILISVVDTIFVGQLGAEPLAAMGFTFPVAFLLSSLSMGLGVGLMSVVSRTIGSGDLDRTRRLVTDGLLLATLVAIIGGLTGLLFLDPIFRSLGATDELMPLITEYMTPYFLGIGLLAIPMVGNAAIRATGDTRTPSLIMAVAGIANAIFDPLLIFGLGPFPRLELRGAAYASVASWSIAFFAAFWILARRERLLTRLELRLRPLLASWRAILQVAIPAAGTQALAPLASGVLTRLVAAFGAPAVAAFGVGARIESLAMIGILATTVALAPFVGQNFGAGRIDRVREGFAYALRIAFAYGFTIAALLAVFARPIASLFAEDAAVLEPTVQFLRWVPVSYGLFGAVLMAASMWNALGRPMRSAALVALRLFVLAVPLAWLGARAFGLLGLFAGIALANGIAGLAALWAACTFLRSLAPDPSPR